MRPTTIRLATFHVALVSLALVQPGCLAMRQAAARQRFIDNQTQNYTYHQPIGAVWPQARQILFEAGMSVKDTGEAGGFTLETDWGTDPENQKGQARFLVQGIKVDDATCQVHFTKLSQVPGQTAPQSERDLTMEWKLIQRVEPQQATEITNSADQAAAHTS